MDTPSLLYFRITAVKQETSFAKTFTLQEVNGKEITFEPGQFLTFVIETEKQEYRRSYSILTLPGEPLKITVKKVTNGLLSRFILQHWHEGEVITALPPAGRFTLRPQNRLKRDVFCFAAGSGIVPILPVIRNLLIHESQSVIHLIYSNHNEEDTLFLNEIEVLSKTFPSLRLHSLFSDPVGNNKRARLSNLTTEVLVNELLTFQKEDAVFLICGPFTYMRMLTFTLGLMHFPKENIKKENFLPEIMRSGNESKPVFPAREVLIELYGQQNRVDVKPGDSILKAALKHGLRPPYSCEGGVCGICAAKCEQGAVHMSINEVLTDSDLRDGWVLTCTGYPAKDGTIIKF